MGWTKRQLCEAAFSEIGMAGYTFDMSPEQLQGAVLRLDSMLAAWELQGIRRGYALTEDPQAADPDQDSNLPDTDCELVYCALAIRLAPGYGKVVSNTTKNVAKSGMDALQGLLLSNPLPMQLRANTPSGAGNKRFRRNSNPFLSPPVDVLTTGPDGALDIDGPVPT